MAEHVPSGRKYGYDALRIACALAVCLYHYEVELLPSFGEGPAPRLTGLTTNLFGSGLNAGSLAVCLFFMLSGALSGKYLTQDDFSPKAYYRHRALRLLPPLWLSWLLVRAWGIVDGRASFSAPAWSLVLSVLGLDGYLQSTSDINTFYLVGEWFYGALVLVTLIWPAVRAMFKVVGRGGWCAWPRRRRWSRLSLAYI